MSTEIGASERLVVLILVGLIGSGKSTFAEALEQHVSGFVRCNQDDLGSRQRVEARARECLSAGFSVCIDRTNFDVRQRATWIGIAREFRGAEAWVLVFDTPYDVCVQRLRGRTDHPTIKSPADALQILARFHSQYQAPLPHEGYTRFLSLSSSEQQLNYTSEDVHGILDRMRDAPQVPQPQTRLDAYFPPTRSSPGRWEERGWREHEWRGDDERGNYTARRGGGGRGYYRDAYRPSRGTSNAAHRDTYASYDRHRDGVVGINSSVERRQATKHTMDLPYSQGRGRGWGNSSSSSSGWRRHSENESGKPERTGT